MQRIFSKHDIKMDVEWDDLFDDDLDILEIIDFGFPRRIIYDRTDDFNNLDGLSFFSRYRLTKPTVMNLLVQAQNDFEFRNV